MTSMSRFNLLYTCTPTYFSILWKEIPSFIMNDFCSFLKAPVFVSEFLSLGCFVLTQDFFRKYRLANGGLLSHVFLSQCRELKGTAARYFISSGKTNLLKPWLCPILFVKKFFLETYFLTWTKKKKKQNKKTLSNTGHNTFPKKTEDSMKASLHSACFSTLCSLGSHAEGTVLPIIRMVPPTSDNVLI